MAATLTRSTTSDDVAAKAARLVTASERLSFDPIDDVDWSVPVDDDTAYHLPPEFLPLYGTPAWEAMTEEERRAYSRHECAALCAAGIWFENVLMQLVLRHLNDLPATDGAHRYLLLEVADECHHSTMFGEYIRRAGTPAYHVALPIRWGARILLVGASGPEAYAAILAAEELLDVSNRATMKDDRVHPTSRRMAKIHVLEEARHVSFARAEIADTWEQLPAWRKAVARVRTPFVVWGVQQALVNREVPKALGIRRGWLQALTNPHHRERVRRDLGKLTGFLDDLGAVDTVTRPLWKVLGLA